MQLNSLLSSFLITAGRDATIKAGGGVKAVSIKQKNELIHHLLNETKFNKKLIVVITIMFVILFGVGVFFTIYYRDNPKTMGIIFGGSFLTLIAVMRALQNLWAKKCRMDMLLTLIPGISPEQTVMVIETLLYSKPVKEMPGTVN